VKKIGLYMRLLKRIPVWVWLFLYVCVISVVIAETHGSGSIISFDEGFHGGAVLAFRQLILYELHIGGAIRPTYLIGEFINGVTLYPPLWSSVATFLSFIFGRSVGVFRDATLIFYGLAILFTYWFVKKELGKEAPATAAAVILSTVPMVVIYSHLMMLEVPLMLGIEFMVVMAYLTVANRIPRKPVVIILITLGYACAPLTKLAAFPVAWIIIGVWFVVSSLLFVRERYFYKFFRWEIPLYFLASFFSITFFTKVIVRFLHVNPVEFHTLQTQQGSTENPIHHALQLAWENRDFYLRDFHHMPILSLLWFGSVVMYLLWKRTPFALFLLVWVVGVYATFSGILPQVPQYITAIYVPLAVATGIIIAELGSYLRTPLWRVGSISVVVVLVCIWQFESMHLSEGYQWRDVQTGQLQAAEAVASQAKPFDRVISWHDGTTFALQMAGYDKSLQIINGTQQICPTAMVDSFEWGVTENQPPGPSAEDISILDASPWEHSSGYNPLNTAVVYHNSTPTWPFVLTPKAINESQTIEDPLAVEHNGQTVAMSGSATQPFFWGCYRLYPYGKFDIEFSMRATTSLTAFSADTPVIRVEYSDYPTADYTSMNLTASDLSTSEYKNFLLSVNHQKFGRQGEVRVFILQPIEVNLQSIIVTPR